MNRTAHTSPESIAEFRRVTRPVCGLGTVSLIAVGAGVVAGLIGGFVFPLLGRLGMAQAVGMTLLLAVVAAAAGLRIAAWLTRRSYADPDYMRQAMRMREYIADMLGRLQEDARRAARRPPEA